MTTPGNLLTEFSFVPGSPDLAGAVAWLRDADLGFAPREVNVVQAEDVTRSEAGPVYFPFDEAAWEKILVTPGAYGFDLGMGGLTEPMLSIRADGLGSEAQLSGSVVPEGLLKAMVDNPGLIMGARGDAEDAKWQGEESPQHYEWWYDGEWEHLPRCVDRRGRERIDVTGNPGRRIGVVGLTLWAAQDLWFGPHVDLLFDPALISTLPVGTVTDLGAGRWHVRLWVDGTPLPEIRSAQQALRDHFDYPRIEGRVDEIRKALGSMA